MWCALWCALWGFFHIDQTIPLEHLDGMPNGVHRHVKFARQSPQGGDVGVGANVAAHGHMNVQQPSVHVLVAGQRPHVLNDDELSHCSQRWILSSS